ncbi:MAG TPA: carbonic anhydrase [Campylobacterales bacterium]|nr:carbonic anhydrase [Campylobacterales bacterium]
MSQLLEGNLNFRKNTFPKYEKEFLRLVREGQTPKALLIGCSDSRVIPDLVLNTKPGDLFIVRNVGNFVPPYSLSEDFHATASALEYGVSVLNVSEIIILGHTHCGACATLHSPEKVSNLPHLKKWLKLGEVAKTNAIATKKQGEELLRATERFSLITQLDNLLTYPEIKKRVENGSLHLHGWIFDIETGAIEFYDSELGKFLPLDSATE